MAITEFGFVYTGQEDLVHHNIIKLNRWSEPLLRHKEEESPTQHELRAIEGGREKSVVVLSKPLEATGLNEGQSSNSDSGVSVLVVGAEYKKKASKTTTSSVNYNLPVQAQHGGFSTRRHPLPQPSTEDEAQLVPLPHFMNVMRRSEILSFPDSTAIDYDQQLQFPSDANFEDKGSICPPDFDVPVSSSSDDEQTPSVPVQSSEAVDHSAILINQPMKAFVNYDFDDYEVGIGSC